MDPAKPSLQLLRSLTDQHVLGALMRQRRLTRAELAAETGISKPTVGESVRRLTEAGLVVDTGQRTAGGRGRGRVGSYYALAGDIGLALAVSIAPEGIVAECVSALRRHRVPHHRGHHPAGPARAGRPGPAHRRRPRPWPRPPTPPRGWPSSAPPTPWTGPAAGCIHLPDAPFLLGELDPVEILAPLVNGPVTVDNDVNWAARAEAGLPSAARRRVRCPGRFRLPVSQRRSRLRHRQRRPGRPRPHRPGRRGVPPHHQRPRRPGPALHRGLRPARPAPAPVHRHRRAPPAGRRRRPEPAAAATRQALARAVSGVLAAIVALADPELVILGGAWGGHPAILAALSVSLCQVQATIGRANEAIRGV